MNGKREWSQSKVTENSEFCKRRYIEVCGRETMPQYANGTHSLIEAAP